MCKEMNSCLSLLLVLIYMKNRIVLLIVNYNNKIIEPGNQLVISIYLYMSWNLFTVHLIK